jgi:hypothetical protein
VKIRLSFRDRWLHVQASAVDLAHRVLPVWMLVPFIPYVRWLAEEHRRMAREIRATLDRLEDEEIEREWEQPAKGKNSVG